MSRSEPSLKLTMAHIATPGFLSSLKHLYPLQPTDSYVQSPWYAVAAITFSASNCPEAVPLVLEYVLRDLDAIDASHQDQLTAVRKIRDAVFKSGLICGFPKVINALILLHQATPPALQDKETLRNPDPTVDELTQAGKQYFDQTYGETAKTTQDLLSAIYPDLGYFITSFGYGYGYAFMGATSPMETSFAMISALIAIDTPRQIVWHLEGAIRNGATREEVRAVRAIAMRIAKEAGVVWKHDVPDHN
ncbi:AhpD-like protein [Tylopilus felleus]